MKTETIYSDIPVPKLKRGSVSKWEKFKNIKVGECVFVNGRKDANALKIYLKRNGLSVVTRKGQESDMYGVWRIEDE